MSVDRSWLSIVPWVTWTTERIPSRSGHQGGRFPTEAGRIGPTKPDVGGQVAASVLEARHGQLPEPISQGPPLHEGHRGGGQSQVVETRVDFPPGPAEHGLVGDVGHERGRRLGDPGPGRAGAGSEREGVATGGRQRRAPQHVHRGSVRLAQEQGEEADGGQLGQDAIGRLFIERGLDGSKLIHIGLTNRLDRSKRIAPNRSSRLDPGRTGSGRRRRSRPRAASTRTSCLRPRSRGAKRDP